MRRRRRLGYVRLLLVLGVLLLAALSPFAAAAAHDREPLTVATGGSGRDGGCQDRTSDEGATSSKKENSEKRRRFRTRKVRSGEGNKINNGRVAFTADYSRTRGHPSKHN